MIQNINIDLIIPHPMNPRTSLGDLNELVDSIKAQGVLQNLTVVSNDDGTYTNVIGHRRHAAAKLAGLTAVPCEVKELSKQEQVSTMLLENMQRTDLTLYEEAKGFQMCMDLGMTLSDISTKTGLTQKTVKHRVKVLELDQDKVKSSRNGTIEDYIALEEIEDINERNRLLDFIGTDNFMMEVEKAKVINDKPNVNQKSDKLSLNNVLEVMFNLRLKFMQELYKRKIEKEEFANAVGFQTKYLFLNNFKISSSNSLFNKVINSKKSEEELFESIDKHKINYFVVSLYAAVEKDYKKIKSSNELTDEFFKPIYDYLNIFGYKLSNEEKSIIDGTHDMYKNSSEA